MVGIHSEDCRARIEKAIAAKEPERFERVNQILAKLASHEEAAPGDPAGGEGEEPNPVLKRARTRLEKSQQAVGDASNHMTSGSGSSSGIPEEERKSTQRDEREREMMRR